MRGMTSQLYVAVGCMFLVALLAPLLVQLFVTVVPLLLIAGLVVVVVRLVWFYTSRY